MSTQDIRISDKTKKPYPFKVSDEYFDNLTARIMEQIPDESVNKNETFAPIANESRKSIRWWLKGASIAASLILIATVAIRLIDTKETAEPQPTASNEYVTDDEYNEALMTYSMADNFDVYYYLEGDTEE